MGKARYHSYDIVFYYCHCYYYYYYDTTISIIDPSAIIFVRVLNLVTIREDLRGLHDCPLALCSL